MVELAIDLLGADTPEEELCRGALDALEANADLRLHLFGHASVLAPLVSASPAAARAVIVGCAEAITNYDNAMEAYTRAGASLVRAMNSAREGETAGVITCGSTGAVLVCAIMLLGKRRGERPALAVELKNAAGDPLLLLDCGANIDCRAELLVTFAHMGDAYMKGIGYASPRISLLSNGSEDTKGCETVKAANALLRREPLHFLGNIEPTDALRGQTDVIVCDGFHGNILLKAIEGVAKTVIGQIKELTVGDAIADEALAQVYRWYDYNTQGGAALLGVNRPVMKGHGAAGGEAVCHMIERAYQIARPK